MHDEFDSETIEDAIDDAPGDVEVQDAAAPPKRGRGRPTGLGKVPGSGRKKGSPRSYSAPEVRAELIDRSNAIGFAADVVAGRKLYCAGPTGKPGWYYPTMRDRIKMTEVVLGKVIPDLQSQELTGAEGSALIPVPDTTDTRSTAIAILSILREAQLRIDPEQQTELVIEQQRLPHRRG